MLALMKNHLLQRIVGPALLLPVLLLLYGCRESAQADVISPAFEITGTVTASALNEISGIQAGPASRWYVQNDDGKPLIHVIDLAGKQLAAITVNGAKLIDWEDLTAIPPMAGTVPGPILVIGDIGDNHKQRKSISLYMLPFPVTDASGQYPDSIDLLHRLTLRYPDGPRDCESMAYDPGSGQILLLSKRDVPPRLYGVDAASALSEKKLTLEFLGVVPGFRPPAPSDLLKSPKHGHWVSQPTGMDISADGRTAAVITYRSLYLFQRKGEQSWPEAFLATPIEILGPPGLQDEAVGISHDQESVVVTTEQLPAPIYRLELRSARVEPMQRE